MRLVLDITMTHDGGYEGRVTVPGTDGQYDFSGILELLAILEQQVRRSGHEDAPPAGRESGPALVPTRTESPMKAAPREDDGQPAAARRMRVAAARRPRRI